MSEISEAAENAAGMFSHYIAGYGMCVSYIANHEVQRIVQQAIDSETANLRQQLAEAKAREERLVSAINWACGCNGSFDPPDDVSKKPFWWRRGLHEKAGLKYDPDKGKYVFAEAGKRERLQSALDEFNRKHVVTPERTHDAGMEDRLNSIDM